MSVIKVYLVDYDRAMTTQVSTFALNNPQLGIKIVGTATNQKRCMDDITRPDVIKQGIDVFVISVHLPGKNGLFLANSVRNMFKNAKIIMTVDENTRHLVEQVKQVADDYIVKPFYVSRLFSLIREVVSANGLDIRYDDEESSDEEKNPGNVPIFEEEPELRSEDTLPPPLTDSVLAMVYSAKGGDGKSTVATNVAAALAKYSGKRVCIVDLDLEWPCVATELDLLENKKTIMDIADDLANRRLTVERLRDVLVTHPKTGLQALLGPLRPEEASVIDEQHIKTLYAYLRQMFDIIVVDSGVSVNNPTLRTILEADQILLVVTPTPGSLQKNVNFKTLLRRLQVPLHKVHLVLNRYDPKNNITPAKVEEIMQMKVKAKIPFIPYELQEASNRGELVVLSDKPDVRNPFLDATSIVYPYFKRPAGYRGGSASETKPQRGSLVSRFFGKVIASEQ